MSRDAALANVPAPRMAKASVALKPESADALAEIGECLDAARRDVGWTLDQLAAELGRDARQVARWIRGDERTQVDVVFAVEPLRRPFVVALALVVARDDSGVVVSTDIRVRRTGNGA